MDARDARTPSPRNGSAAQVDELASACERVASHIRGGKPQAQILEALQRAESLCAAAVGGGAASQELTTELSRVSTALETWRTVWPRLSQDRTTGPDFRAAVIRECGLWSRRLRALAEAPPRPI